MCADLLGDDQGLLVRDGLHLAGAEGVGGGAVISQVELGAHQDDGDAGGVVFDLREPLDAGMSVALEGHIHSNAPAEQGSGRATGETLRGHHTLALTLSKEGGLTIEKQIRKTSVCG